MIAESPTPNGHVAAQAEAWDVTRTAEVIAHFVLTVAEATKVDIRTHCKGLGIDTDLYQRGFARVANQLKLVTEVTRDDGTKAYQLKRRAKALLDAGLTLRDLEETITETAAPAKPREHYTDWQTYKGHLVLTFPALASRPVVGNQSARQFERGSDGSVLLFSGNFAAMVERALRMPAIEDVTSPGLSTALRYQSQWDAQMLPASVLTKTLNPVPPAKPGQSGQGLTEVETLPAGTRIPFAVTVPGSHVEAPELWAVLVAAGRWVGFSPAAAHLGWGRFTVERDAAPDADSAGQS